MSRVRGRLEARLGRQAFYDLAEAGVVEDGWFGVWSGNRFWPTDACQLRRGCEHGWNHQVFVCKASFCRGSMPACRSEAA
jgi:hypothetical protein